MLRYIFLKLSGFTSKKEFALSSSCNRMLMARPSSSIKKECRQSRKSNHLKPTHKRSYSFPSRTVKSRVLNNDSAGESRNKAEDCTGVELTQRKSFHQNPRKVFETVATSSDSQNYSSIASKQTQEKKLETKPKYYDVSYLDETQRYELESSKPKRSQSELIFNVFDYVAKEVDLTDYLQPNNLRPFGSQDNIYLPLLVSQKNLSFSENDTNLEETLTDIPTNRTVIENPEPQPQITFIKEPEKRVQEPVNPIYKVKKKLKSYKEKLNPVYNPKTVEHKEQKQLASKIPNSNAPSLKSIISRSLDIPQNKVKVSETIKNDELVTPRTSACSKGPVKIEPPPFLPKREDMFTSISFADSSIGAKRSLADYRRLAVPWPAYSDRIKSMTKRSLITYPSVTETKDDVESKQQCKLTLSQSRNTAVDVGNSMEDAPKTFKKTFRSNTPQRRTMSTEHIKTTTPETNNSSKKIKSSTFISDAFHKHPVAHKPVSFNTKKINLFARHSYAKSSQYIRKLEPKSCKEEKKKKCFLPSKVRLKPPKCTPKVYEDCGPPPCPPRADECLKICRKVLPLIMDKDCPCVEPLAPHENPKLKRLKMKFEDEPRICPCVPVPCPCPPPIRADDCEPEKEKKLLPYKAAVCECVENPPMVDVPLVRLVKKECVPSPKVMCEREPCPEPEPCCRADDCLVECPKKLRPIEPKPCKCIDYGAKYAPKMKRLCIKPEEPPRICPEKTCPPPCEPCLPCDPCFRSDDCLPEKIKKLRPIIPGDCPCIEQPMVDVKPLPRLQCKEEPEECLCVDPCLNYPRADWGCWEYLEDVEPKKSDKTDCEKKRCIEYKQKRKFNTNSGVKVQNTSLASENCPIINRQCEMTHKNVMCEMANKNLNNKSCTKVLQSNKAPTLPRNFNVKKAANTKPEEKLKQCRPHTYNEILDVQKNNSMPLLLLLKDLEEADTTNASMATSTVNSKRKEQGKYILTSPSNCSKNTLQDSNIRKLSTVMVDGRKKRTEVAKSSPDSRNKHSDNASGKKEGKQKTEKKDCKIKKCPGPMLLKGCPAKEERSCDKDRILVCCEKKQSPNPAFSECMDEKIEPFSNTSQWKCDRQEYGFEPNPKKAFEPLDKVREKKKFSTFAIQAENMRRGDEAPNENPIVTYFSARYTKPVINGESRKDDSKSRDIAMTDHDFQDNAMSDVIEYRAGNKDHSSVEEKYPKLLHQKSNYTVAGVSSRKMSSQRRGTADLQPGRPSPNVGKISSTSSSTTKTKFLSGTMRKPIVGLPFSRQYSGNATKDDKFKSECKKKKACDTFKLNNCPEKTRNSCEHIPDKVVCEPLQPPYPSFTELMDDEIEDKLTECPLEKERIQHLQPRYPIPLEKPELLDPVVPQQGKIDPKIEENCIRERLCLQNEGLTQDCSNFGEYIQPLKSRNYFKDTNKDCERIEELKKLGKWPPKDPNSKQFSTNATSNFNAQRRKYSCSAHVFKEKNQENLNETHQGEVNDSQRSNKISVRSFHALSNHRQAELITEEVETDQYQSPVFEDSCKYKKLRNVQWRINPQKWRRPKKIISLPNLSKTFHTCSKLKSITSRGKKFSTSVSQTSKASNISMESGFICSKLKYLRLNKHAKPHKTFVESFISQRRISTSRMFSRQRKDRYIRFPIYPKPIRKLKTSKKNMIPAPSEQNVMQPLYPGVPEVDTVFHSNRPKKLANWVKDRITEGEEKGKSFDCSAVHKPFIKLNSSSFDSIKSKIKECLDNTMTPCTTCGEVFMQNTRVYMKSKPFKRTENESRTRSCPKLPLPQNCGKANKIKQKLTAARLTPEPECPPKPEPLPVPECLPEPECPPEPKCSPKTEEPPPQIECEPAPLTVWQKIANYFKARPNCPAPDEWKKRALKEKAEKAAKAAGLCLVDPKDLPQNVSNESDCENTKKNSSNDGCFSSVKSPGKVSKRHYSSGINWENFDELLEEDKRKQLTETVSHSSMKEMGLHDDDAYAKNPDPLLESVFKEAVLEKDAFNCLGRTADVDNKDECIIYSLKIVPSGVNTDDSFKKREGEVNDYNDKVISELQEYFNKIDGMTELTYEELEKAKTKSLIKELDSLLIKNQESNKKN